MPLSTALRARIDLAQLAKPLWARAGRHLHHARFLLRAAMERHGIVLMYHRIAEPGADPWDLAVSPANFAAHLEVLQRYGRCVSLADFAGRIDAPDRPKRMIAVTFDDGNRDNLTAGVPALAARDVPATIFVVSGTVGAGRDFWWDALARVFLTLPELPAELSLEAAGTVHSWQLGTAASCAPAELRALAGWSLLRDGVSHPRQTILLGVWEVLNALPMADAERLCEIVTSWAGADRSGPATDHTLSAAELAQFHAGGLVEIGGHTVSHLPLDTVDPDTAAREIGQCRADLGDMVGHEIRSFSYPFGRYGAATPALVRAAGFDRACTSSWSPAFCDTDRFRIPRIGVTNMDGDHFAGFLHRIAGR